MHSSCRSQKMHCLFTTFKQMYQRCFKIWYLTTCKLQVLLCSLAARSQRHLLNFSNQLDVNTQFINKQHKVNAQIHWRLLTELYFAIHCVHPTSCSILWKTVSLRKPGWVLLKINFRRKLQLAARTQFPVYIFHKNQGSVAKEMVR